MFMISRRTRALQSAKYTQKKRKKSIIATALLVLCVGICLGVVILAFRLPFFQITTVKLESPGSLPASELEQKALALTEGSYFGLIPRSSTFFYPKDEIEAAVMSAYKKIETLRVVKKSFTTLEITTSERKPEAVICEGFREEDEIDECFFADVNGYVFSDSPGFSDGVYPRYYANSESNKPVLGNNFMDASRFKELQAFLKGMSANGITTLGILIGEGGSYELYMKNRDQSTAVVYFDDRTSFDKTMSNLVAFWDNTKDNFDYINLRFGNNVFYSKK